MPLEKKYKVRKKNNVARITFSGRLASSVYEIMATCNSQELPLRINYTEGVSCKTSGGKLSCSLEIDEY